MVVTTNAKALGHPRAFVWKMGDEGLEPRVPENDVTTDGDIELQRTEQIAFGPCGAESGAVGAENKVLDASDGPRLRWLIDAWPMLSNDIRNSIAKLASLGQYGDCSETG